MVDSLNIPDYQRIDNLRDLENSIRFFKKAIKSGVLKQYWLADGRFSTKERAEQLGDDGTFPDYIEMYFVAPDTGKKYKFTAETYHGSGGEWTFIGETAYLDQWRPMGSE